MNTWRLLLVALVLWPSAARAERPWPILVRTYYSAQAGPAASFELSADGRTWQGVPGDIIPGTGFMVRAIHFLPQGVLLSDESRKSACTLFPRQSPWYRLRFRTIGDIGQIPRPEKPPEPPPASGTAAWYVELAHEYRFAERYSEADVVAARALELGARVVDSPAATSP